MQHKSITLPLMATTTVRLDDEDESALDRLASTYGGRSRAIREALHRLDMEVQRKTALASFLQEWDAADGPVDEEEIDSLASRYGL